MTSKRVLLVNPDTSVQQMLGQQSSGTDLAVDSVSDTDRAIELCARGDYQLVIANLDIPVMGAIPFLHRIKLRKPEIAIIVLSAFPSMLNQATAFRSGADEFVAKPFDAGFLRQTIRHWLN